MAKADAEVDVSSSSVAAARDQESALEDSWASPKRGASVRFSPAPRHEFLSRKDQILASLDKSPKGSLDAPILDFLSWLNAQSNVVTTSSCSGRTAIFLGSCNPASSKGGDWLYCNHDEVQAADEAWKEVMQSLQQKRETGGLQDTLLSFLFEPFLLHAECADVETAQCILEVAREVGLRESGLSLGRRRVMVQLRSLALRLEVPLALHGDCLVSFDYFKALVDMANERLRENARRTSRLWESLRSRLAAGSIGADCEAPQIPWILSCPQPLARSIKLALEEHGWMDESRKMATFSEPNGSSDKASGRIGLPITSNGVKCLQELPASSDSSAQSEPPAAIDSEATAEPLDKKAAKAARAAAALQPANIEALWRRSSGGSSSDGIFVVQSDALPMKVAPVQKGAPGKEDSISRERDALLQATCEAHAKLGNGHQCALAELLDDVRSTGSIQWRGDVALLPRGSLSSAACEYIADESKGAFWESLRVAVGARLLARQREIKVDSGVREGAVDILAGEGDGWVIVPGPKGVRYTLDIKRCMFSEGNAAEKARVAEWRVQGQTVLDLYAGIGFWTLPLLVAGAEHVFSCEWNPDAIEALHRGLSLLGDSYVQRCKVLEGDNRRQEVVHATAGRCDRVMLGLIPTSRAGFPVAVRALKDTGGLLHVHWNVSSDSEAETAAAIAAELQNVFCEARGEGWSCRVVSVQRIKWYAPRVRHVRIDVACEHASGTS